MSIDVTLSARVAEEILAMLARKRMNKSELARRLGVSHTWVTNRLTGNQEIGLDEFDRIGRALNVPLGDLLPRGVAVVGSVADLDRREVRPNAGSVRVAEWPAERTTRCAPDVRSSAGRGGIHRRPKARQSAAQPIAA